MTDMSDPFHDRIADWLYGVDDLNGHRALLADIDRDRALTFAMPATCRVHGDFEQVGCNDDCPGCEADYDRMASADANFDARDYRPGNATTDNY